MIVIYGTMSFAAENEAEFLAAVRTLVALTRAEEGCVRYTFAKDLDEPGHLHIFEEWTDEAALKQHMAADHFRAFGRAIRGLGVTGSSVDRYEATGKSKLM